jgi:hypothetical protein
MTYQLQRKTLPRQVVVNTLHHLRTTVQSLLRQQLLTRQPYRPNNPLVQRPLSMVLPKLANKSKA